MISPRTCFCYCRRIDTAAIKASIVQKVKGSSILYLANFEMCISSTSKVLISAISNLNAKSAEITKDNNSAYVFM